MKWSTSSLLLRSPLIRIAAMIPVLGYFVLYGDSFSGIFNFENNFGDTEIISPTYKARLVYYGALFMGLSFIIYIICCPEICKRLRSPHEAVDEFVRIGTSNNLEKAVIPLFKLGSHKQRVSATKPLRSLASKLVEGVVARTIYNRAKNDWPVAIEEHLDTGITSRGIQNFLNEPEDLIEKYYESEIAYFSDAGLLTLHIIKSQYSKKSSNDEVRQYAILTY